MLALPMRVGLLILLLLGAGAPECSAATDTLSAGQVLAGDDRLVSNNSKFTLGFFRAPDGTTSPSSSGANNAAPPPDRWYLGIWFTAVPNTTTVWVANGANPIADATGSPQLIVSDDGDLVVVDQATRAQTWSTRSGSANGTATNNTNTTAAVLLNTGNLVLFDASSNSSSSSSPRTLWQSFDHPTDTLLPTAKLGRDKRTGLNRHLVSRKSAATPSPGPYCYGVDPDAPQLVMRLCDSGLPYWSSGPWNGKFFSNIPELSGDVPSFRLAFVDDAAEEYLQYNVTGEPAVVTRNFLDVTGQNKHQVWLGASQGWLTLFASPKSQCDVYASCGPFSVCGYSSQPVCGCMKGFSVKSQTDWDQGYQRGGCVRDAPLDCTSSTTAGNRTSGTSASSTDGFFPIPNIGLPDRAQSVQNVTSSEDCSTACLNNCSCSAYSYGSQGGCLVWQDGLLDTKSNGTSNNPLISGQTLHLRLAASEFQQGSGSSNNKRGVIIGVVTGACALLGLLVLATVLLIIRRNSKTKNMKVGGGLAAFTYRELRSATRNFSEKLGQGGFGSVFKGQLRDSTAIAVKRLGGSFQGEKQFRAEVSSIGVIQHINLVRLVGFCCDGDARFLVYEHMPNRSLDIHLFNKNQAVFLPWATRYQVAIGVARGLAYLHESCRECIIHCDVKPQNILLDAAFLPKIADFGMAKFVGRDFSRVLTTMRGTKGYLAPEWISGTAVTPKVDVYSYGMVLLELVSGRRNSDEEYTTSDGGDDRVVYFPMRAARELLKGDVRTLLDEKLCGDANLEEVERACKVACWCIQDDEDDRPTMGEVVQILEGVMDRDMPPLPRLLENIFGRPESTASSTSFTGYSGRLI